MHLKRARLIYNPTSGREEMKRRLPDILQKLDEADIATTCHATTGEGDATAEVIKTLDSGAYDMIIAAGGDGTLYEIINGMANHPKRIPLGIIPLGTTNDFARALCIPRNWEYACELIINQYKEPIDVGRANDRYFINIAGGGFLTELTYDVPIKLKTMIGQLAYYLSGAEKLIHLRPTELTIKAEAVGVLQGEFMMFLICNSNSVGGFEQLVPNSELDDGMFDVLIVKKCNLAEFIKIITLALRGEHLSDPNVIHLRTRKLEITSPDLVQLNLDGEYGGNIPAVFENLKHHIEIYVDETGNSTYK